LTIKEVAEKSGVSETLVRGWIADGSLPHYRLGSKGRRGTIRIDEIDLEKFLEACRQGERRDAVPPPRPQPVTLKHLRLKPS